MSVPRWVKLAAVTLGAGVVMPLALVSTAGAFVDPATMKKLSVVAKVGGQVGTKLMPLRMVASANPVGLVINTAFIAGALYLQTDSGQALEAKAWNWITGGPKPAVAYPESGPYTNDPQATQTPTRTPDYCRWTALTPTFTAGTASTAASVTQPWSGQSFSPYTTCQQDISATGNWWSMCKTTVAYSNVPAGTVGKGFSGNASGYVGTPQVIPDVCGGFPLVAEAVPVSLEWYAPNPIGAYYNSFYVQPVVHYNPAVQINGQDGALAPSTVLTIQKDCKDTASGAVSTVTAAGLPGTSNLPNVECPAGTYPVAVRIFSSNGMLNSDGSQSKLLNETTIPQNFRDEYPRCIGPTASGCQMWIEIDGQECSFARAVCHNWWDVWQKAPSRVKCMWGPPTANSDAYDMQVVMDCSPLRHAYQTESGAVADPQRSPQTLPVPNVAPVTSPVTDPVPWPVSDPYPGEDPETSPHPQPNPTTNPNGQPTTGTNPGTTPGTNPGTRPGPESVPAPGSTPLDAGDPANCWETTWTWNPISWVFTPVKCALVWAFVPTPATLSSTTARFAAAVGATSVGAWSNAFSAYPAAFASSGGASCMGPAMTLGSPFNVTLHPAQTCSGPSVMLSNVCKFGVGALLAVAGSWACARLILAGLGYNIGGGGDSA